jgi:hypothetical protein
VSLPTRRGRGNEVAPKNAAGNDTLATSGTTLALVSGSGGEGDEGSGEE